MLRDFANDVLFVAQPHELSAGRRRPDRVLALLAVVAVLHLERFVVPQIQPVEFRLNGKRVVVCIDANATDSDSLAVKRRDASVFGEFAEVAPFVEPQTLVLDLGAHIGLASLYYLSRGHAVTSFEPSQENLALLHASRERNDFDSWTIVPKAVSERTGTATFYANGPHGHLDSADPVREGVAQTVETIALDDWFSHQAALPRIGLVKIDIEGAEVGVLRSARHVLGNDGAPPLFVESNGHCLHWFGETPTSLRRVLGDLGYRVFAVRPKRLFRPTALRAVAPASLQARCVVNYFCVKDVASLRRHGARIVEEPPSRKDIVHDIAITLRSNDAERAYLLRALPDFPDVAALPDVKALLAKR